MKLQQRHWAPRRGWQVVVADQHMERADLVLYFASPGLLNDGQRFRELQQAFPTAQLVGCSTGGEILGQDVFDGTITATAVQFGSTTLRTAEAAVADWAGDEMALGRHLAEQLRERSLRCIFVLSDGTQVNGSELVRGFRAALGETLPVMGGLAGDGDAFQATRVGLNANPAPGKVVAFGLYGDDLRIGHGSYGGWQAVGPTRMITRSAGNILHDLDGQPALDLYKKFLGEEASNLPASALLFPLRVHPKDQPNEWVVRTIIGIDEAARGMIFAGDMPEGHMAQMMLGNVDQIVEGAGKAASQARISGAQLGVLVSCIGRKLLLKQRIAEEVEAVGAILGPQCRLTGFYSYGEIGPQEAAGFSDLHNQTMTITTIGET